jgi:hypothetical protein
MSLYCLQFIPSVLQSIVYIVYITNTNDNSLILCICLISSLVFSIILDILSYIKLSILLNITSQIIGIYILVKFDTIQWYFITCIIISLVYVSVKIREKTSEKIYDNSVFNI